MKFRYTLRDETMRLRAWLRKNGRRKRGWKLRGRVNEIWRGGQRFWMDVRRVRWN